MERDWKKIILDENSNKELRIQAAFRLEDAGDDNSIKAIGEALFSDPSPIVRHECAFALGETSHPEVASEYLMKAVEKDKNIFVRHEAILALATLGKQEFIPFVKKYLDDPEPDMVESAEIALLRLEQTSNE